MPGEEPVPDLGLIETLLWTREAGFWLLELHFERLAAFGPFRSALERDFIGILRQGGGGKRNQRRNTRKTNPENACLPLH